MQLKPTLIAASLCLGLATASANAAPFYSNSTVGSMGAADAWSGNQTNSSVILEVFFDYTTAAAAESGPLLLWEVGDTSGSSLTIKGTDLLFASRHSNTQEFVQAAHGLTAPAAGVQVVSVFDLENDLMTMYVNGSPIGSAAKTQNDWSGGESAALGTNVNANQVGARPHSFVPGWGSPIGDYPDAANANFSFNAYLLASNDLGDILVPEPSSLALLGLGGLMIARRRRG